LTAAEANAVRWDQGADPFYEVWYLIAVEPSTGDGLWIRYTLLNPLEHRAGAGATLWFGYTCRADPRRSIAITRTFPTGTFTASQGRFDLALGAVSEARRSEAEHRVSDASEPRPTASWRDLRLAGEIPSGPDTGGRSASWELTITPESHEVDRLMPAWLRAISDRRTALTIPYPRLTVDGEVTIDGQSFAVRGAGGHQAHHWGRARADAWDWAHCAHFEGDPTAVLEALAPVLPGGIRLTFLQLRLGDRVYRCDRLWDVARNRSAAGLGWWHFVAHDGATRIEADLTCAPERMLAFTYLSPSYAASRCWNTQIGDCLVRVFDSDGREQRSLRSRGRAAAEMHRSRRNELPYESWTAESTA